MSKELNEQEISNAQAEAAIYGISFMRDGKHIPLENVMKKPTTLDLLKEAARARYKAEETYWLGGGYHSADIELDFGILGERSVTVFFDYQPESKGGFDEPPTPAEYEIVALYDCIGDVWVDLSPALDEKAYKEIERVLEKERSYYEP